MSLSDRINRCPVCNQTQDEPYLGLCTNYRFHVHGVMPSEPWVHGTPRVPEWIRRKEDGLLPAKELEG